MPFRLAGLCSGARSLHSMTMSITFWSMSTEPLNFSPPCTTRCPTALISLSDLMHPYSASTNISKMNSMPAVCSAISRSMIFLLPSGNVNLMNEPLRPIFSMPPCAAIDLSLISKSLYLMDELPQFNTNIFMVCRWFWLLSIFLCSYCLIGCDGDHLVDIIHRAAS